MKRDIYAQLIAWKQSSSRKPLVLKGARQVGKTYILRKFGEGEYDNLAYFNFEEDPDLAEVDFVAAVKNQILPLEVKAGISRQKKSLLVYGEKFKPLVLSRSTLMNFKKDGKIINYPLYAVSLFLNGLYSMDGKLYLT